MNIVNVLVAQSLVWHLIICAGITYCFHRQHAPVSRAEKWLIGLCWLLPGIGPITLALYAAYFYVAKLIQK